MTLLTKKGAQQMIKIPITVPKVLAAFFSLENLANFRAKLKPCVVVSDRALVSPPSLDGLYSLRLL